MDHTIAQGGGTCGPDEWAVLDSEGNQVGDCYADEASAQAAADALNADAQASARWHAFGLAVDVASTDGREFASAGGGWRDLPLPVMLMTANDWGHAGARSAGLIDTLEMRDGMVYAEGTYNSTPEGEELRGYVERQELRWVSADVEATAMELIEVMPDGSEAPYDPPDILWFGAEDHRSASRNGNGHQAAEGEALHEEEEAAEEESGRIVERYTEWQVMGLTVLPFPAFPQCVIAPIDVELPTAAAEGENAAAGMGMARRRQVSARARAASVEAPTRPPAAWFSDPEFGEAGEDERLVYDVVDDLWACPLTLTADGRVFGHLAPWEQCHVGYPDVCLAAPPSRSGYAYFLTGALETAEGGLVAVGQISLEGGHPDLDLSYERAQAAYADTRSAACDVAVGEDGYGIWFAGAVRPGLTEDQRRVLLASPPSADWRPIAGGLELIAILSVNTQGHPVPRRTAKLATGPTGRRQTALVAAGAPVMARLGHQRTPQHALGQIMRRLDVLEARTAPLMGQALAAMRAGARAG